MADDLQTITKKEANDLFVKNSRRHFSDGVLCFLFGGSALSFTPLFYNNADKAPTVFTGAMGVVTLAASAFSFYQLYTGNRLFSANPNEYLLDYEMRLRRKDPKRSRVTQVRIVDDLETKD